MPANSVTHESIRELMDAPGPCVTLISKSGPELTKSLNALRREIGNFGADAAQLLGPIESSVSQLPSGPGKSEQLAIFRSPSILLISHVGPDVKPIARIADRFDLRTLLTVACAQRHFHILALSQNRSRLLACTQDHSEEVPFPEGIAVSLEEDRQTRKPDHVLDDMSSGGPSTGSMKGVMSTTSTEREDKDEFLLRFFKELDRGVNALLKDSNDPLVVVGVEREIALYKRANSYRKLIEPGVHGAPDGLEGGEMHKRALELLRSNAYDGAAGLLNDFDKKVGTGHASTHIQEIVAAAYEGRVSHLFFQDSAHYMGSFDAVRQRVKHSEDPLDGASDLVESSATQTLTHGGDVRVLNASAMPNGVPVCALFRYAAPQTPAVGVAAAEIEAASAI